MMIMYECYNSWNAFNSFILRLYKGMYVIFVRDLENRVKEAFVLFFSQWLSFFAIPCSLDCM